MKKKYEKIKKKKISTSLDDLCKGLPEEIKVFLTYARELKFDQRPDYTYLKNLIRQITSNNKLAFSNNKFDWIVKQQSEKAKEELKDTK